MDIIFNSTVNTMDNNSQCFPEKSLYCNDFNENNDSLNPYDNFIESENDINNRINKIFFTKSTLDDYEKICDNEEEFNKLFTYKSNNLTFNKGANPVISQTSLANKVSAKTTTEKNIVYEVKVKIFEETETQNKPKRTYENKKYKMGRKKKTDTDLEKNEDETNKNKIEHTRMNSDNLRTKFKRGFINYLISFINKLIRKNPKLNGKGKIQKIKLKIIINMSKQSLLKFLDLSAREFLSQDISVKCKTLQNHHNKNLIKYIYDIGDTTITEILDKSMRELMHIFCEDKKNKENEENDVFQHFDRLQDFIDNYLKVKDNNINEEYIEKFKYQALNFEEIIKSLEGRGEN